MKKYRLKEVFRNGASKFYPQYNVFLFWRNYCKCDSIERTIMWYACKEEALLFIERQKSRDDLKDIKCKLPKGTRYYDV